MKLAFRKKKAEAGEGASVTPKVPKKLARLKRPPPAFVTKLQAMFETARFTLLIGDEGAILVHMKGDTVLSRQFVADASAVNLQELRETIAQDPQAPITMVIDSVDQSFVQQTLPPVSSLSVQKLIKRRLDRDFKAADIKGAVVLGRDKEGRKDWNFMMVSIEKSPQLVLWLDFVMTFENRFRGIVLLSVESAIFIRQLERALGVSGKTGTGSEWKILVSHNKVGGFRQIIMRNGRMIFTRLALPVGEPTPAVIAGNIEQEMMGTIEYLKRFGFNARNGLDVYIIASEEVCRLIESGRFDAQNFHALSPHTVAGYLGIKGATQPTDQFGDVVMASAIGMISKNILKLTTLESRLFDKFQLFKYSQRLIGTFAILGLIIYAAYMGYQVLLTSGDLADSQQKQRINQQALAAIKARVTASKIDIELVGNQIELYKQIKSEARSPLPFIKQIGMAVKQPVSIKSVIWKFGDALPAEKAVAGFANYNLVAAPAIPTPGMPGQPPGVVPPAMPGQPPMAPGMPGQPAAAAAEPGKDAPVTDMATAVLVLEFPAGIKTTALFKKFSEDFLKGLNAAMPTYAIALTSVPPEYLDTKSLQMDFDEKPVENTLGQKPVTVEVTIRGMMPTAVPDEGTP